MILYRILLVIALLGALTLAGGTIYGVFIRPAQGAPEAAPSVQPESAAPQRPPFPESDADLDSVFSGIGRIRSVTAGTGGTDGAAVVLSIAFPYNSQDRIFAEELASQIPNFRTIARDYFSSHSLGDLKLKDEETIKTELLAQYNQILRLGSIKALYFSDYMIIE